MRIEYFQLIDRIIELLSTVQYEKVVMDQWGFSRRFSCARHGS